MENEKVKREGKHEGKTKEKTVETKCWTLFAKFRNFYFCINGQDAEGGEKK